MVGELGTMSVRRPFRAIMKNRLRSTELTWSYVFLTNWTMNLLWVPGADGMVDTL